MTLLQNKKVYVSLADYSSGKTWFKVDDVLGVCTHSGFKGCVVSVKSPTGKALEIRAGQKTPEAQIIIDDARKLQAEIREAEE